MQIFDISRALSNDLAPWPGDTPFHFELNWKMAEGATVNVGAVRMGVHNGTHADAPFHFERGATTIEMMPLEIYLGDAVLVDLSGRFGADRTRQISVADIESCSEALEAAPRLLLKTGAKGKTDWIGFAFGGFDRREKAGEPLRAGRGRHRDRGVARFDRS